MKKITKIQSANVLTDFINEYVSLKKSERDDLHLHIRNLLDYSEPFVDDTVNPDPKPPKPNA